MDHTHVRATLEQELAKIELELTDIGILHRTKHPLADTGVSPNFAGETADENILADQDEEQDTNKLVGEKLQARMEEIRTALIAVDEGTYGTCSVCGSTIENERLEANSAATTCIAHA
jgi:RNA polymerase-binding transcription factor DksA